PLFRSRLLRRLRPTAPPPSPGAGQAASMPSIADPALRSDSLSQSLSSRTRVAASGAAAGFGGEMAALTYGSSDPQIWSTHATATCSTAALSAEADPCTEVVHPPLRARRSEEH